MKIKKLCIEDCKLGLLYFDSISELAEWVEKNIEYPNYLPEFVEIDSEGYTIAYINMRTVPYNCTESVFKILCRGILDAVEELGLTGIVI